MVFKLHGISNPNEWLMLRRSTRPYKELVGAGPDLDRGKCDVEENNSRWWLGRRKQAGNKWNGDMLETVV